LCVFRAPLQLGGFNFSEPKNLGGVINSNKDDFSFKIDKSDSYGYFFLQIEIMEKAMTIFILYKVVIS
jgi:hypothetical protein